MAPLDKYFRVQIRSLPSMAPLDKYFPVQKSDQLMPTDRFRVSMLRFRYDLNHSNLVTAIIFSIDKGLCLLT